MRPRGLHVGSCGRARGERALHIPAATTPSYPPQQTAATVRAREQARGRQRGNKQRGVMEWQRRRQTARRRRGRPHTHKAGARHGSLDAADAARSTRRSARARDTDVKSLGDCCEGHAPPGLRVVRPAPTCAAARAAPWHRTLGGSARHAAGRHDLDRRSRRATNHPTQSDHPATCPCEGDEGDVQNSRQRKQYTRLRNFCRFVAPALWQTTPR